MKPTRIISISQIGYDVEFLRSDGSKSRTQISASDEKEALKLASDAAPVGVRKIDLYFGPSAEPVLSATIEPPPPEKREERRLTSTLATKIFTAAAGALFLAVVFNFWPEFRYGIEFDGDPPMWAQIGFTLAVVLAWWRDGDADWIRRWLANVGNRKPSPWIFHGLAVIPFALLALKTWKGEWFIGTAVVYAAGVIWVAAAKIMKNA